MLTHHARSLLASLSISIAILAAAGTPVAAARPLKSTSSSTGNDISWPQCGKSFPSGQAFGIVGVNGGLANTLNPCLGPYNGGPAATSELAWAWASTGTSKLPQAALYVNTANPSPVYATSWPSSGGTPYGPCLGGDTQACAWQYGWDRATQDMAWLGQAASDAGLPSVDGVAATYQWWLDVETANSWETGTTGQANNVADLEGMVAAFVNAGVPTSAVGIYSTSYQWGVITGGSAATKNTSLKGLPNWIPGARTQSSAQSNCSLVGFTGPVVMTQWFGKPYDGDVAC